jgi:TfoX/Sxy family transcriptional regulator of competence genes
MATRQSTIDFILDQLGALKNVRSKKMFGEYALYYEERVVALVCDDQLFVKPTSAGKALLGERCREGIAYPGAKPSLLIDADELEDHEKLTELIRVTAEALPPPKPKAARRSRALATTSAAKQSPAKRTSSAATGKAPVKRRSKV